MRWCTPLFNSNIREAKVGEFQASLVYSSISKTAKTKQNKKNPTQTKQTKKKPQNKQNPTVPLSRVGYMQVVVFTSEMPIELYMGYWPGLERGINPTMAPDH